MKKLLAALTLLTGIMTIAGRPAMASDIVFQSSSIVNRILVPTQNVDLDLNQYHIDNLSVQVVYSSASPATVNFGDGTVAVGSVLVSSLTALTTNYATNVITVVSTQALANVNLYINGTRIQEGDRWTIGATTHTSAVALCDRLNKDFGTLFRSTVNTTGSVINSTAVTAGSAGNAFTCTSSSSGALACGRPIFTGGQDAAVITLNNVTLTANTNWQIGASTIGTARNISAAINADSRLKQVMISSHTNATVTATSTIVGVKMNFACTSSTPAALACSGANFTGGTDANITLSASQGVFGNFFNYSQVFPGSQYGPTNTINQTPTRVGVGQQLLFSTLTVTAPTPLINQTTYFASNVTATSFTLADTSTGAVAGLSIAITTTTQTGGGTFRLTPLAISGTPSWKLQKSNDGSNFQDVYVSTSALLTPFAASTSFASPYTASNALWDLGDVYFRYLRFAFTGSTAGGVNVNYIVNGKRK